MSLKRKKHIRKLCILRLVTLFDFLQNFTKGGPRVTINWVQKKVCRSREASECSTVFIFIVLSLLFRYNIDVTYDRKTVNSISPEGPIKILMANVDMSWGTEIRRRTRTYGWSKWIEERVTNFKSNLQWWWFFGRKYFEWERWTKLRSDENSKGY